MPDETTGVIIQGDAKIAFIADGFRVILVRVDYEEGAHNEPIIIRPDENGYLWGVTDQGKIVAIYVKHKLKIYHTTTVNTCNYIIFAQSINSKKSDIKLNAIRFQNGSVRSVYPCGALHTDLGAEKALDGYQTVAEDNPYHYLVYRIHNDCKKYDVVINNETVTWTFGSVVTQGMSAEKGEALTNDTATLTVDFNKEVSLKAFYDYYGYVSALLGFLTYRKDVGYEKIELLARRTDLERDFLSSIGECHVKMPDEISYRHFWGPVQIRELDADIFQNIVRCIIQGYGSCNAEGKAFGVKKRQYSPLPMDIIPNNDKEVDRMTLDNIRCICSDLEVELDAAGIKCGVPEEIKDIIKCTKKVIHHFRQYSGQLGDKTYDHLFSSLGHWGNPLSERAIQAWEMHEQDIYPMFNYWRIDINTQDIEAFIKTRNNITHRGFRELDQRAANTGIALIGLIYCMALKRVGLSSDTVREVMRRRLID